MACIHFACVTTNIAQKAFDECISGGGRTVDTEAFSFSRTTANPGRGGPMCRIASAKMRIPKVIEDQVLRMSGDDGVFISML